MPVALNAAVPFTLTGTILDNNSNRATFSMNLPSSLNDVELLVWVQGVALLVEAVTDGFLESMTLSKKFAQTGNNALNPSSEVERKMRIPLAGVGNARSSLEIPSPSFALDVNFSDIVNPANPAVAALVAFLLNGTAGANNGVTNITGVQMDRLAGPVAITHRGR